jgi:hypothetical protein
MWNLLFDWLVLGDDMTTDEICIQLIAILYKMQSHSFHKLLDLTAL